MSEVCAREAWISSLSARRLRSPCRARAAFRERRNEDSARVSDAADEGVAAAPAAEAARATTSAQRAAFVLARRRIGPKAEPGCHEHEPEQQAEQQAEPRKGQAARACRLA